MVVEQTGCTNCYLEGCMACRARIKWKRVKRNVVSSGGWVEKGHEPHHPRAVMWNPKG